MQHIAPFFQEILHARMIWLTTIETCFENLSIMLLDYIAYQLRKIFNMSAPLCPVIEVIAAATDIVPDITIHFVAEVRIVFLL